MYESEYQEIFSKKLLSICLGLCRWTAANNHEHKNWWNNWRLNFKQHRQFETDNKWPITVSELNTSLGSHHITVGPRYNEPRYNEDPAVITNNIWKPGRIPVKYVETNPAITSPAITNPAITKSPL